MIKQKKNAEINKNRKEKTTQEKLIIQLEEIYQKVLAKEGRLKKYRQRIKQYRQIGYSKILKESSINNWKEMTIKHTNKRMQKKPNNSELKYGNQKNIMKRLNA